MVSVRSGVGRRRPVAHLGGTRASALSVYLFLEAQTSEMWIARGARTWRCRAENRRAPSRPSATTYRTRCSSSSARGSTCSVSARASRVTPSSPVGYSRHLPAHPRPHPPPSDDALTARFPRIRRRRRARARLLGHLAARQARVRALRLVRSDERANPDAMALLVRRARVVVLLRRRRILCSLSLRASIHEDIAGLASAGFAVAVHPSREPTGSAPRSS